MQNYKTFDEYFYYRKIKGCLQKDSLLFKMVYGFLFYFLKIYVGYFPVVIVILAFGRTLLLS